jgi:hypothetical protein
MSKNLTDTRIHKYSFEGKKSKLKSLLKDGNLFFKSVETFPLIYSKFLSRQNKR